jgi:2-polyprenyl-3-methyl-5-hydroxy-6-metoxy-1,4-benzoquinol methylase
MSYIKEVFEPTTIQHAMHICLTSDPENPNKFLEETSFFVKAISEYNIINPDTKVLDFGCGMGRISRGFVEYFGCNVIGLDANENMLKFANIFVGNPKKFTTVTEYKEKETIDVAVACFVLQHVQDPDKEIQTIYDSLKLGGHLILLNENIRYVPDDIDKGNFIIWKDDEYNIFSALAKKFDLVDSTTYMNTDKSIKIYKKV